MRQLPFLLFAFLSGNLIAQDLPFLDPSFGEYGKLIFSISEENQQWNGLAEQEDGQLVLVGFWGTENRVGVVGRINPEDGSFDDSFGEAGIVLFDMSESVWLSDLKIQYDGKILISGSIQEMNGDEDFLLIRLLSNGELDDSFGVEGIVQVDSGFGDDAASGCHLYEDGRILISGRGRSVDNYLFMMARVLPGGLLDKSFGNGGLVSETFDLNNQRPFALDVDETTGKIALGGTHYNGDDLDYLLAQYQDDGSLDINFGTNGYVITDFDTDHEVISDLAYVDNGKIICTGYAKVNDDLKPGVAKYNNDGSLDETFAMEGLQWVEYSAEYGSHEPTAIIIQEDSSFIISGTVYTGESNGNDFFLAEYTSQGALALVGNEPKVVVTDLLSGLDVPIGSVFTSTVVGDTIYKHLYLAGFAFDGTKRVFAVTKYKYGNMPVSVYDLAIEPQWSLMPNPCVDRIHLNYDLAFSTWVSVGLHQLDGKLIKEWDMGNRQPTGSHQQSLILPNELSAGLYLISLRVGPDRWYKKIVKN